MVGSIQDGIYYNRTLGNSFCLTFIKISRPVNSSDLATELSELWKLYDGLKKGKVKDLDTDANHSHHGNLSVLLGYGPKIFDGIVYGMKKKKPYDLVSEKGFLGPNIRGGDPIIYGSSLNFSKDIVKNHAVEDHIVIQFIADSEMFTNRALVETWKHLRKKSIFSISKFYTGFSRIDKRGWLGFHDGISNFPKEERLGVIAIDNSVVQQDNWLINGTYMAFISFIMDLENWENLSVSEQELIIGRKKKTGCAIVGFDHTGNPINDPKCPIPGTSEVIDDGNENFRQHKPFAERDIPRYKNDKSLSLSHIYRVSKPNNATKLDHGPFQVYRQGFEFLERIEKNPGFQAGLNFISFQNKPEKLIKILTLQQWLGKSVNTNYYKNIKALDAFNSARAAGIFLIPPLNQNELFPGSIMFL